MADTRTIKDHDSSFGDKLSRAVSSVKSDKEIPRIPDRGGKAMMKREKVTERLSNSKKSSGRKSGRKSGR
jgi:hypothetical protein